MTLRNASCDGQTHLLWLGVRKCAARVAEEPPFSRLHEGTTTTTHAPYRKARRGQRFASFAPLPVHRNFIVKFVDSSSSILAF